MDDPQLQRAIYASIQTARNQGYRLDAAKPTAQFSSRSTYQPSARGAGGGGNGGHGGAAHTRSAAAARSNGGGPRSQPQRPQHPQHGRSYAGNSLPGVGAPAAAAAAASASLRTSFGRVEALRRDGIVPASAGPLSPPGHAAGAPTHAQYQSRSHANGGPPSPTRRAQLAAAVPPRTAPSPHRARGHAAQKDRPQQRPRQDMLQAVSLRSAHPVLEAIAAVTSDAHAAFESVAAASPAGYGTAAATAAAAAAATASPLIVTPLSPSGRAAAAAAPPPQWSPKGAAGAGAASGAVGGGGSSGPPPRGLVQLATPGGSVAMVPEGVDPVLAQAVLRDAVTWDTGVTFDDIAGCDRAKQLLHEAVALPLIIPEFFTGIREPWRGVLLHGPPGNGKTMLAKALAGMVGGAFFAVSPASLTSKWRGESEKLLAALFAVAQAHAPAIIFIDEVDALGSARGTDGEHEASRRFKAELLQQMDGLASGRGVMVLAATNCPWDLDPALRRRLEKRIHIGLPDVAQRLALLQLHLRGVSLAPDVDLPALAAACEGFSGADIRLLCRDAAMAPLRRQLGGLALPQQSQLQPQSRQQQQQQPTQPTPASDQAQPQPQPQPLVLLSAADIRRLADSGELARGSVVAASDLEATRASLRPSVTAEQAALYVQWDLEFASA